MDWMVFENLKTGWLSPAGEFTRAAYFDHISVATTIDDDLNLPDCDPKTGRRLQPDEKLINAGYVLIGRSMISHGWRIEWSLYHTLTPEQRQFLAPYFEDRDHIESWALMRWEDER